MATTTGGTTYVTSTDLVANYPTASLALANRVDVVASGGPNSIKTSGYTITLADILGGNKFLYNSASPGTFTLPTSGLVDGMTVNVAQIGAGALTVSGGTIVGTTVTTAQYQALRLVYAASGTTWYSVAESAPAGLTLISSATISASSTISFNNVFSTTYDNYLILIRSNANSANANFYMRLRAGGTDYTTANYQDQRLVADSTIVTADRLTGQSQWRLGSVFLAGNFSAFNVFSPYLATNTGIQGQAGYNLSAPEMFFNAGGCTVSNLFDGFTIYPASGTMTAGFVRVYGYKNS